MWKDPVGNTPSIVQTNFGPWGTSLPADGESYCAPTSVVMGLYYLGGNGFTQLAPASYAGPDDRESILFERLIAGIIGTSPTQGTGSLAGLADYFAARGLGLDQYTYISTGIPDVQWLDTQLAPNYVEDPQWISLTVFSVGWFYKPKDDEPTCGCTLCNDGGHTLAPLKVDLFTQKVTLNNAYPMSFLDVPNEPSSNPQTVELQLVPEGMTVEGLNDPQQYSEVMTDILGSGDDFAILWLAESWIISASALPTTPGYAPATWQIDGPKSLNTNEATLTVLAPLAGRGGFVKYGEGTLLLTNSNRLMGRNEVCNGTLASTLTTDTPFGTWTVVLRNGGALALAPETSDPVAVEIASGHLARFIVDAGGGTLRLDGTNSYSVTLGGCDDGELPNIVLANDGTLAIAPGGGISALGTSQKVLVTGTDGNLPIVTDGIVTPAILGIDTDLSGKFVTYDVTSGFIAASPTLSTSLGINSVTVSTVYEVVDEQVIDSGAAPQLAALELNGGTVSGSGAQLLVGNQAAGGVAGIIMNAGSIGVDTLTIGAAAAIVYASTSDGLEISSNLSGSGGLSLFGPGTLTLSADNSGSLSGMVNVNTGTLIAAGTSATGSGTVQVHSAGRLEVTGSVAGPIDVAQGATLHLENGTLEGAVSIAAVGDSPMPGGIFEGAGVISGEATIGGIVRPGPLTGILEFQATATIAGSAMIYWRLEKLVADVDSKPGEGWNGYLFNDASSGVGLSGDAPMYLLEFAGLGVHPDAGDPFWKQPRRWQFMMFPNGYANIWFGDGNLYYSAGNFGLVLESDNSVYLTWTPTDPQGPAQRRRAQIAARNRSLSRK
ncbi:hypothetical protein Snov_0527 [Ancylobacter novellus DSM 506]|uniref:Uncharacterized protein n=1 Tax=Ancylobacter novellus (strain ATCC 8093 / DSM 506 / JCM 20403 / CCM 1077 / IAM 12100 / NBRC 12443 / NCIMB 10456) TaxID=639283 RepID=D7A440_ANCN5|nr:hypothetical protein [Ancylobacter novellus]ADH87860.1 hypothetical protein Snov_0527 [Ancylobacter novellus DSM 506]